MGQATGKPTKIKKSKIHSDHRPYMYLEREILEEVKKRDSYDALNKDEFFCGIAAMIREKADPSDKAFHLIEHMATVAEDALGHAWEGVRKWSNMVFDKVEKSMITWADKQEIKEMRYAISWFKSSRVIKTQVPCDSFNMEGKECVLPDEHSDDKYVYHHRCAVCWYALPHHDCKHSTQQCKRRKGMQNYYNDALAYKPKYNDGGGSTYYRRSKPTTDNPKN